MMRVAKVTHLLIHVFVELSVFEKTDILFCGVF